MSKGWAPGLVDARCTGKKSHSIVSDPMIGHLLVSHMLHIEFHPLHLSRDGL